MKKSIIFLVFILFSAQIYGYEKRVSSKTVKTIATTTLVIDALQTLSINSNPDIIETNPALNYFMQKGKTEGALATIVYFGGIIYAVNKLPPKYDPLVNALSTLQIGITASNFRAGIGIDF